MFPLHAVILAIQNLHCPSFHRLLQITPQTCSPLLSTLLIHQRLSSTRSNVRPKLILLGIFRQSDRSCQPPAQLPDTPSMFWNICYPFAIHCYTLCYVSHHGCSEMICSRHGFTTSTDAATTDSALVIQLLNEERWMNIKNLGR